VRRAHAAYLLVLSDELAAADDVPARRGGAVSASTIISLGACLATRPGPAHRAVDRKAWRTEAALECVSTSGASGGTAATSAKGSAGHHCPRAQPARREAVGAPTSRQAFWDSRTSQSRWP